MKFANRLSLSAGLSIGWGLLLTIFFLWPILTHFTTHLPSYADGMFISATIYWVSTHLGSSNELFSLPIFHPYTNTLAYSDPFISTGVLSWPLTWFTKNVVTIHNVNLVAGTIGLYLAGLLLSKELSRSWWMATLASTLLVFGPWHMHYVVHLHTYLLVGLPLMVWCLIKWLQPSSRHWWLVGALLAFLFQALNSPLTGFFALSVLSTWWLTDHHFRQKLWQSKHVTANLALMALGALWWVYAPYFAVSREFSYVRTIRDAAHFAHSLNIFWRPDMVLMLGLVIGAWWLAPKKPATPDKAIGLGLKTAVSVTVAGGLLMLGPALKLNDLTFKIFGLPIPLPYAIAYYLIPGFQAFRTSSRWIVVFALGIYLLLSVLGKQLRLKNYHWLLILLFSTLGWWYWQTPHLQVYPIPLTKHISLYRSLANRPEQVMAEFPMMTWRMFEFNYLENDRLLGLQVHNKKLYNGTSGFTPPQREKDIEFLWQHFPDDESVALLRKAGMR